MGKATVQCKNKVKKPEKIEFGWDDIFNARRNIPEGFKTAMEIAKEVGYAPQTVRPRLKEMVEKGTAESIKIGSTTYYKRKV